MTLLKKILLVTALFSLSGIVLAEVKETGLLATFISYWESKGWLANFVTIVLPVVTSLFALYKLFKYYYDASFKQKATYIFPPADCTIVGEMDKEVTLKQYIKYALDDVPDIEYKSNFKGKCKGPYEIDFILDLDNYETIALIAYYGEYEYLDKDRILSISKNIYNFLPTDNYSKVVIVTNSKIKEKDKSILCSISDKIHFIEKKCTVDSFISELSRISKVT